MRFVSEPVEIRPDDWDPRRSDLPQAASEVVSRTMAEIMGLAPGYCGGRGGSMHLRWAEAGIIGTNAIVGGGIPLATGSAYASKLLESGAVVVSFFGDGAANQGAFHESLNLASIWDLPAVYVVENNGFAVGTRATEAARVKDLSIRAASYGMRGRIVDGNDVPGLYAAMKETADAARKGEGPCLLEVKCYRHLHHAGDQPGSAFGYRDKDEESGQLEKDATKLFSKLLVTGGGFSGEDITGIHKMAEKAVRTALDFCTTDDGTRIREELWPDTSTAGFGMRSDGKELEGLPYKEPKDFTAFRTIKYSDAVAAVAGRWMEKDRTVVEFGEEVANFGGGAYGGTKGLPRRFPDRVINTPISEAGFVGLAGGAAMSGMRPVVEVMYPDFTLVAADQFFNQIAKARHMYGGTTDLPLIVRTRVAPGCGYGGQHSMDPVGLFSLFSGWRVIAPSNAFDYIGLFNSAIHSLDPVMVLEHHSLYNREFPIPEDDLDYCIPLDKARLIREGDDITIVTYMSMVGRLEALTKELGQRGVTFDLIDLRSVDLPGIDYETIGASVKKTGVIAVVEQAAGAQGIGERINAQVTERFFDYLDAPPGNLTSLNVPNSVSRVLEEAALLDDETILETIEKMAKRRWK